MTAARMAAKTPSRGGLLAEIQAETRTAGKGCAVGRALRQLPPDVAADLETALLADPDTYPGAAIARAITARGIRLSAGQVNHHRRGCTCGK